MKNSSEYLLTMYLDGKVYKKFKSKKGFCWDDAEKTFDEILNKYPKHKHVYSIGHYELYLGLDEDAGTSFCVKTVQSEYTGFKDKYGEKIFVGDKLYDGELQWTVNAHCTFGNQKRTYYIRYVKDLGRCSFKDIQITDQSHLDNLVKVK